MSKLIIAVEKSQNSKTGDNISATYAPIQSCPKTCVFLNKGCYAQYGHTGIHLSKLNKECTVSKKTRPIDIARSEAKEIRKLSGKNPLRLHIVGDCQTPKAAEIIAAACADYMNKHNQIVWGYTHAWKVIPREKWGKISILASCETLEEVKYAHSRGYAASIVRAKPFENSFIYQDVKMIACKEQIKGIKCSDCKLCMNDKQLLSSFKTPSAICFFAHGPGENLVKKIIYGNK
jgi:hypothetical protein